MNFESNVKSLGFCEICHESAVEHSLECEFNLPDYCPEIKRIVKCCVEANVISVQRFDGKISAQVNACVRVIYVGDNNKIFAYDQIQPVQKTFESDKITSDSVVNLRVNSDYVNCRAISARRVDIKAMLSFVVKILKKGTESVLSSAFGCGIETLENEYTYCDLKAATEKSFNLTEVTEISSSKPSISRIIASSAYINVSSTKIINNKMLIKGDCYIKVLYISDSDFNIESAEHSIPVSQIIEIDGVTDNCETTLDLCVTSCEAVSKIDSSGESKLIDFNIRVSATVLAFENADVTLISDLYSTKYKSDNNIKYLNVLSKNTDFNNTFTNKVTLESIGVSVDSVCGVWCEELKHNYVYKNKKCSVQGSYQANILYSDTEKQIGLIQKTVDFEFYVDLNNEPDSIVCYPSLQIEACSCSVSGESRLELKTEILVSGKILSSQSVRCVVSSELNEDNDKKENCALTIYFTENNEKVWDIAKKYNTSVSAIMNENDLGTDIIENKRILLIPSV